MDAAGGGDVEGFISVFFFWWLLLKNVFLCCTTGCIKKKKKAEVTPTITQTAHTCKVIEDSF